MKYEFSFEKYQGCGNDFILKDEMDDDRIPDAHRSEMAKFLWDRHFWVGADGVLFVEKAPGVDGSMRLFEPAGNEADMCGNGLRCVAAFLMEKLDRTAVDVLTKDGVKHAERTPEGIRVDMGLVRTQRKDMAQYITDQGGPEDSMMSIDLSIGDSTIKASLLNTGEPHIIIFTDDIRSVPMVEIGTHVNSDRIRFPKGMNINYVQITGVHDISVRTYERGVYNESMACGTGSTACAAASLMLNRIQQGPVNVKTLGGMLVIEIDENARAVMTGPAEKAFEGKLTIEV
ncbi:MAG: diaminopimelate epimerase [Thermoplasmata archaeon]|nr:diaminopimelate epimerase [Thermoplasmata archaeon]